MPSSPSPRIQRPPDSKRTSSQWSWCICRGKISGSQGDGYFTGKIIRLQWRLNSGNINPLGSLGWKMANSNTSACTAITQHEVSVRTVEGLALRLHKSAPSPVATKRLCDYRYNVNTVTTGPAQQTVELLGFSVMQETCFTALSHTIHIFTVFKCNNLSSFILPLPHYMFRLNIAIFRCVCVDYCTAIST
jgi:hypothetical protein